MADIKTNLRETSVLVGVYAHTTKQEIKNFYNLKVYCDALSTILPESKKHASNIFSLTSFTTEHISILKNGFSLANILVAKLNIQTLSTCKWLGYDTQKENPVDIVINDFPISLKEDSYILENMGLYKYLTLMTGIQHKPGVHVFEQYALAEYNAWFKYTWSTLLQNPNWNQIKKSKVSSIANDTDYIVLTYTTSSKVVTSKIPKTISTVSEFESYTSSTTREKVFAKWINAILKNDNTYQSLKKQCSIEAGKNLTAYVLKHLNYSAISRLLQIYDTPYYYAKTTNQGITLLYVPAKTEYTDVIKIDSIQSIVPESQLNLITTIKNVKTLKTITLRNECRFSHGQFNGTPEAKMYYDNSSDLSNLYQPV